MKQSEIGPSEAIITSKRFEAPKFVAYLGASILIFIALFHLFAGWFGGMDPFGQRVLCLTMVMLSVFILYPSGRKSWSDKLNWLFSIDILCILLTAAICVYVIYDLNEFVYRGGEPNNYDLIAGSIMIVLALDVCRRTIGWVITGIGIFLLIHCLFSAYFPGFLFAPSLSWPRIIMMLFMQDFGLFGSIIGFLTGYLALFFLLVALLQASGVGEIFNNIAFAIAGRFSGGPAKAAVIGSAFVGSITGSAIANVATTGSFTIPMMKKMGYNPHWAAAIETIASSGGQITPPIMGATAFLIAEFVGVPYVRVCLYVLPPVLLFYICVFSQVHFEAVKNKLGRMPKEEVPSIKQALLRAWPVFIVFGTLVGLLARGYGLAFSATVTVSILIVVSFLSKSTRQTPDRFLYALEEGAKLTTYVGGIMAGISIVVGGFTVSGIGVKLSKLIVTASGGIPWLALLIAAGVSIILGMGLVIIVVYILIYLVAIPALVDLGIDPLAAHLFCFFYAVVHGYTWPVAPVAYVAAAIAKASPVKTCFTSMKLGLALYIVPWAFVYAPDMLYLGSLGKTIRVFVPAAIGLISFSIGVTAYCRRRLNILESVIFIIAGSLLILPGIKTGILGAILLSLAMLGQYVMGYKEPLSILPELGHRLNTKFKRRSLFEDKGGEDSR
jgi:TRAP transporter 4TM/12TM fusion protein